MDVQHYHDCFDVWILCCIPITYLFNPLTASARRLYVAYILPSFLSFKLEGDELGANLAVLCVRK